MQATTEERIQTLEEEVAWLKAQVNPPRVGVIGKTRPNFLDSFTGIFADDPAFEKMDSEIQEEREKERREAIANGMPE